MILLDTNVCVGILRGDRNVLAAYAKNAGNVAMSAMTVGELFFGAEESQNRERNLGLVEQFVAAMPIVQTDNDIMRRFGRRRRGFRLQERLSRTRISSLPRPL